MKLLIATAILFLTSSALSKPMYHRVDCTGYTKKGETYKLTAIYNIDEEQITCEDPCTVQLKAQPTLIDLSATFKGKTQSYSNDSLNSLEMYITDDQTSYLFTANGNKAGDFVEIIPPVADAPAPYNKAEFKYQFENMRGHFRFGQCDFSAPTENL